MSCPDDCPTNCCGSELVPPKPSASYTKLEYDFQPRSVLKALGVSVADKDTIEFKNLNGKLVFTVSRNIHRAEHR